MVLTQVTEKKSEKSRIPGVRVGELAPTSLGPKKKVCFNIGGKYFFRMVDPDWQAPGRPHKAKKRRAKSKEHRVER